MNKYAGVLLVTPNQRLLLQQRDDKPGIVNPGMITTFGGACEANEDPLEAACRELSEETNLKFKTSNLHKFTVLEKTETDGSTTELHIFTLKGVDKDNLKVFEGKGIAEISSSDNLDKLNLSISARKIVNQFFSDQPKQSKSKFLIFFLVISIILNILLGLFSYSLYRFRAEFIFTEEFAVMAMPMVSRNFCEVLKRERPELKEETVAIYCKEVLETSELDTVEINGETVEIY